MATSDWKDYLDNHQKKIVQLEERYKKLLKEEPALASTVGSIFETTGGRGGEEGDFEIKGLLRR